MSTPRRGRRLPSPFEDPLAISVIVLALVLVFASWPVRIFVVLVILAVLGVHYRLYRRRLRMLKRLGIGDIDTMTGEEFENRLWVLFTDLGYRVERTPYRGDWGADLVLTKDGARTVVQAKRYAKPVGIDAIQQVVTAKAKYGCENAIVVTNATYTRQAYELALVNKVELWARDRLIAELKRALGTYHKQDAE